MNENLALSELAKKLEQNKKQELEQIKQIETESMNELAKSLRTSLKTELNLIKEDIFQMQKSINKNNKTLKVNSETYNKEIVQSFQNVSQELTKIKAKQWIIPTIMGLSIVLALALGTLAVTKHLSTQLKTLAEQEAKKEEVEAYSQVKKTYRTQIEVYQKPQLWQTKNGTWIIELKE